jgi:hypothetical protein
MAHKRSGSYIYNSRFIYCGTGSARGRGSCCGWNLKHDAPITLNCTASLAPGRRRPVKEGVRHAPALTGRRSSPIAGSKPAFAVTVLKAESPVSCKGPLDGRDQMKVAVDGKKRLRPVTDKD